MNDMPENSLWVERLICCGLIDLGLNLRELGIAGLMTEVSSTDSDYESKHGASTKMRINIFVEN